jgi:O-antigen/teichoic acid export membrane protein
MRRYVYRSSLVLAALILPLVAVIGVWGERIMTTIYGNGFSHSGVIALLLTMNLLINALGSPYSRGLFALDRGTIDTLVNLGCVSLMFAIGIASVRAYSVLGAAIAMLVSGSITAVIRVGLFAREARRSTR